MLFEIEIKKEPITLNKVDINNIGDIRYFKKFAWLPIRINYAMNGLSSKREYTWLQYYFQKERYSKNLERVNRYGQKASYSNKLHEISDVYFQWVENIKWNHIDNIVKKD